MYVNYNTKIQSQREDSGQLNLIVYVLRDFLLIGIRSKAQFRIYRIPYGRFFFVGFLGDLKCTVNTSPASRSAREGKYSQGAMT